MNIRRLVETDINAIKHLLNHYKLVTQDIDINKHYFIGIENNSALAAIGALERVKPFGLLRSVATDPQYHNRGYAGHICKALIKQARSEGLRDLYLLTESAFDYFSRQGFESVNRIEVPQTIKSTNQFSTLCPDDASVMKMQLTLST